MKFTIDSQILTAVLTDVVKAVPAKPVEAIMMNYLLELNKEGILRVTATDGEIALRGLVKPDSVESEGTTTVPAKLFLELVKTLPAGPVTFERDNAANAAVISWKTGKSSMPIFDPSDFVKIAVPSKDSAKQFTVTTDILTRALGKTIFAVSHDEIRPVLTGIFFDVKPEGTNLVASDASKLVVMTIPTPEVTEEASFILPAKAAAILKGILPKEQPLTVIFDEKNARFAFGSTELTTRTVVGKYPQYQSVIPTNNDNVLIAARNELIDVLNRMKVVADRRTPLVKATMSFNTMDMTAEDLGMSTKGSERIDCDYDGQDIAIGLKATTVTDVLSNIDAEKVQVKFMDARHAILITPAGEGAEEEPYQAIVMPYRIDK